MQLAAIAVAATWIAGFVDLVGYLLLAHIFTANMSGNSIRIGASGAAANGGEMLRRAWPVAFFTAGLIASAVIHEAGSRRRFLATSSITYLLEAVLLAVVQVLYLSRVQVFGAGSEFFVPAALLAFAMGMQNATLTKVGPLSVRTTHVTGAVSEFAEGLSKFGFWVFDRLRAGGAVRLRRVVAISIRQEALQEALLLGAVWMAFVTGAFSGTLAIGHMRRLLLLPALVALCGLAIIDVIRPIAASAEHLETSNH